MELEKVIIVRGKVKEARTFVWPQNEGKSCTRRFRRHKWSDDKALDNGWHYYKYCLKCKRKRLTGHYGCPVTCWGGPA